MIDNLLSCSLNKINKRHFNVDNPNVRVINNEVCELNYSKKNTQPENNFVTYLIAYYLLEIDHQNLSEDENLTIYPQIQLYKQILNKPENSKLISDFKLKDGLYPDIVFHKNQNDNSQENQKIAVECKVNSDLTYSDFAYDFAKLHMYILEINFQKSVYIIVNNNTEKIEFFLRIFKSKYIYPSVSDKIEIWIKNYDEEIVKLKYI